ncbi:MAG: tripartite tricarboxylate transporter substrate binding protein, partial [Alphaproteobacteria bacterium]|nr:tripartite tricarboxylate transporter substrate binding protein [Alphaproteobacteria bacterium]
NKTLVAILNEPAMKEKLVTAGLEPVSSTPDAVIENVHAEIAKWVPLVKASGAKAE